ncbi:anaerobic sulfatase maturase [Eubacteriales bacterium OttesenSCG-928-A19]|nr:anaerobic sulfatase maturase [Eubacteriales bacterium OttesenSCG-928-A19]
MPPITLLIKPASSLCNMRCHYCFYADVSAHRTVPSYGIMSEATLETLVQKALAFAEGQCTFAFQGGEPTLAGLDFFERTVSLQKQYNTRKIPIHNAIQTNGLVIDEAWARFLAENRFLVGLSLDGDAAIHNDQRPDSGGKGTYARVVHAADLLKKHGCEYNILCVVTAGTARRGARVYNHLKRHQYLQFIACLEGFGVAGERMPLTAAQYGQFLMTTFDLYYHDFMRGQYVSVRTFDNYIQLLLGNPPENCAMRGQCSCNLVVEGDGSVYPCDFFVLDTWRLGTVHENELPEMLMGETARRFVKTSLDVDEKCRACRWGALCRGGCRRDRVLTPDGAMGHNRFCAAYEAFFAYSYERMCEIAARVRRG